MLRSASQGMLKKHSVQIRGTSYRRTLPLIAPCAASSQAEPLLVSESRIIPVNQSPLPQPHVVKPSQNCACDSNTTRSRHFGEPNKARPTSLVSDQLLKIRGSSFYFGTTSSRFAFCLLRAYAENRKGFNKNAPLSITIKD